MKCPICNGETKSEFVELFVTRVIETFVSRLIEKGAEELERKKVQEEQK